MFKMQAIENFVDDPEEFTRNVARLKDTTASLEEVKAADEYVWQASLKFGQVFTQLVMLTNQTLRKEFPVRPTPFVRHECVTSVIGLIL
jgi:hypothetical protein